MRRAEKVCCRRSQNLPTADAQAAKPEQFLHTARMLSEYRLIPPTASFEPVAECLDWGQTFSILSELAALNCLQLAGLPTLGRPTLGQARDRTVRSLLFPFLLIIRETGTKLRQSDGARSFPRPVGPKVAVICAHPATPEA